MPIYISIHAPREGSDVLSVRAICYTARFQSTLPARGATGSARTFFEKRNNFNPRSPRGERLDFVDELISPRQFQSTLPARGATTSTVMSRYLSRDFNPRSPRGERPLMKVNAPLSSKFQSTLPARGATPKPRADQADMSISIHAPREGSDEDASESGCRRYGFQSTLPARGATPPSGSFTRFLFIFQSTLPARGATTVAVDRRFGKEFQSTLPARGATWDDAKAANAYRISIHAPREGSDLRLSRAKPKARNFNPRSPRGERRHGRDHHGQKSGFQSTLPARGAT